MLMMLEVMLAMAMVMMKAVVVVVVRHVGLLEVQWLDVAFEHDGRN